MEHQNVDPLLKGKSSGNLSHFPYMQAVVTFNVAVYLFHTYLDVRQLKAIRLPNPPEALRGHTDPKEFRKTQSYQLDKWWFGALSGVWSEVLADLTLLYVVMPWVWKRSMNLVSWAGLDPDNETLVTIVFFFLTSLKDTILGLPWDLWSTFIIEERHGFNKQTLGLYFSDLVKQLLLAVVLAPPLLAAFVYILQHTGPFVALYLWAFVFVTSMIIMTLYPTLIAPLFNKFDPLPEGQLRQYEQQSPMRTRKHIGLHLRLTLCRQSIEALAGSLKFPLKKLFVIDGSKRSAHSNAYMYGFFNNKRIVLFDTLVEQCNEQQVVAVLAHELGHWKLSHTLKNLGIIQVNLLVQFLLFTVVRSAPGLFESFGFEEFQPGFIAFSLFSAVSAPLNEVVGFLMNMLSRLFEFQADEFAVDLGHSSSLKEALLILDHKNRSSTNVDLWYSTYHHSHPPLVQRLEAIEAAQKKRR